MSTDFRALCAELLQTADTLLGQGESPANPGERLILTVHLEDLEDCANRARAALAQLEPAAASIVQAFDDRYELLGPMEGNWQEICLAAALRAAADQVVPDGPKPSGNSDFHLMNWTKALDQYYQRQQTRDELLAIAAELEAQ
jgi:hypothetical protein